MLPDSITKPNGKVNSKVKFSGTPEVDQVNAPGRIRWESVKDVSVRFDAVGNWIYSLGCTRKLTV